MPQFGVRALLPFNYLCELVVFPDERNYVQYGSYLSRYHRNVACIIRRVSGYVVVVIASHILNVNRGTNGIFGPYQDVSRLFSVIDEARIVDTSGKFTQTFF